MAATFTTHGHRIDDRLAVELSGNVHFIRVSIDGVGPTYEKLRGRSFDSLIGHLATIHALAPFGVNIVVNALTLPDLDRAAALAEEMGAAEVLLLPEQAVGGRGGIDAGTLHGLRNWVQSYQGLVRLTVSEAGAIGLPACDPLERESGLRAYAHIDAQGRLKRSSFDPLGVSILCGGVLEALRVLAFNSGGS